MYVIVKKIKTKKGIKIPVILLKPGTHEILEFETNEEAEKIKELFMVNSDRGYEYETKKL